ncbi:MAG: tRNA pseudouridine(55) synthase TruB [Candidatus Tantalella remota]|nr:tRNA pseudouridine(55) synthase TruB [Candidatus Tantalella remota]
MEENSLLAGILVVDKEKGMTSHDVVQIVRKRFSIKKVGHAGTLDPNATGVLVLLLGRATKLSNTYLSEEKEYEATMKLGERTDSADSDGEVIHTAEVKCSAEDIAEVLECFKGETEQVPPMVSAKKINGERLYKLARRGIEVERAPQKIFIKKLDRLDVDIPFVKISVACSKGTYIRQLADDIGEKLGCGAHLSELRRTRSGSFTIEQAVPFEKLRGMNRKELDENIIRV